MFNRVLAYKVDEFLECIALEALLHHLSAFFRNWSLRSVLEAASWRSNTVFTFYLRNLFFNSDGVHSLGPFVAAGERIG